MFFVWIFLGLAVALVAVVIVDLINIDRVNRTGK